MARAATVPTSDPAATPSIYMGSSVDDFLPANRRSTTTTTTTRASLPTADDEGPFSREDEIVANPSPENWGVSIEAINEGGKTHVWTRGRVLSGQGRPTSCG